MNLLYHLNYIYFSLLITSWFVVSASISTDIQSKWDSSLDCPSAELVSYVNYNYNNSEISLRTFSCTDLSIQETTGPNTQSLKLSSPARTTPSYRTSSIQGRNEEQCKTTGDECQCGTACKIFFYQWQTNNSLNWIFSFFFLDSRLYLSWRHHFTTKHKWMQHTRGFSNCLRRIQRIVLYRVTR